MRRQIPGQGHRLQYLELLGLQSVGAEGGRFFHRGQCEQLQQVVLQHIPGSTDPVVVPGTPAHADVLGHRDLHLIDVGTVPHRLEQHVGKPHRHDVLHRLLAQVVIDAEDLIVPEDVPHQPVELPSAAQVVAEGFLDHRAPPAAPARIGQPVLAQLLHYLRERFRWHREVEGEVATDGPESVQLAQRRRQPLEGLVVVERALDEPESASQLLPHRLPKRSPRVPLHALAHHRGELLVGPLPAREPDQGKPGRQQPPVGQVVNRGQDLFPGKIAGDPENHHAGRSRHPRQTQIRRIPQRILAADTGELLVPHDRHKPHHRARHTGDRFRCTITPSSAPMLFGGTCAS